MKFKLLGILSLAALAQATPARALSVSVFYDALAPDGDWIETVDYGYVWHPREVGEDWRPYTVGSWAYTEAGWTWVSEEPFGWATYHYGRWVEIDPVGWAWVPGEEWGPAWVSWRRSDRYTGWAPLPPEARFEVQVGFQGWVDSYYDIGPTHYNFVESRNLGAPRLREVLFERRRNVTIINETRNITNITRVNNIIINEGPRYETVVRETQQPIRRLRLERETRFDGDFGRDRDRFRASVQGDSLRIAAPQIETTSGTVNIKPKTVNKRITDIRVNRGWRDAGDEQQVRQLRAKVQSDAPEAPAALPKAPVLRGSERDRRDNTPGGRNSTTGEPGTTTKPGDAPNTPPGTRPGAAERPNRGTAEVPQPGTPERPDRPERPGKKEDPDERKPGKPGASRPDGPGENRPDGKPDARPDTTPGNRPGAPGANEPAKPDVRPDTAPDAKPDAKPGMEPGNRPGGLRPGNRGDAPEPNRPGRPTAPGNTADDDKQPGRPGRPETGRPERPAAKQPEAERPRPEAGRTPPVRPEREPAPGGARPDRTPAARGGDNTPDRPERPERPQGRPDGAARGGNPDRPPVADAPAGKRGGGSPGAGAPRPNPREGGAPAAQPDRGGEANRQPGPAAGDREKQGGGPAREGGPKPDDKRDKKKD